MAVPWAAQEVYGKLEEPDGLAGLARLRSGGALLQDQVLAAEKAGSWGEALGLHEQVRPHGVSAWISTPAVHWRVLPIPVTLYYWRSTSSSGFFL